MEPNSIELKKLKSQIALKFGIEFDDVTLAILHILTTNQNELSQLQNGKLDEAIKNFNQSKKSLEVSKDAPARQGFGFGFGLVGISICTFIVCFSICLLYWESIKKDELLMSANLKWYKAYYDTLKNIAPKTTADILKLYPKPTD